jgi:hypothetical protein
MSASEIRESRISLRSCGLQLRLDGLDATRYPSRLKPR